MASATHLRSCLAKSRSNSIRLELGACTQDVAGPGGSVDLKGHGADVRIGGRRTSGTAGTQRVIVIKRLPPLLLPHLDERSAYPLVVPRRHGGVQPL